ncbi:MAG: DUF4276 family protein [Cytophagales bacterium]|nr:MAG: DUF4276 family protein [Cytophagales bacterium]
MSLMVDFQDIDGHTLTDKHQTIQRIADEKAQNKQIPIRPIPVDAIFFMVQKMDAWILSQPTIIDEEYGLARRNAPKIQAKLAVHKQSKPHEIRNPDKEIGVLMGYYEQERRGQWKKLKYSKTRSVRSLLPRLDINQLQQDFEDVRRFVTVLRTLSE